MQNRNINTVELTPAGAIQHALDNLLQQDKPAPVTRPDGIVAMLDEMDAAYTRAADALHNTELSMGERLDLSRGYDKAAGARFPMLSRAYRQLLATLVAQTAGTAFQKAESYHEDLGNVLWWTFPIDEPPYVGSPLDSDWNNEEGYTHFQRFDYRAYDHEVALETVHTSPFSPASVTKSSE